MVTKTGFNVAKLNSTKSELVNLDVSISKTCSRSCVSMEQNAGPCISCTTFNILAPIYKRLDQQNQEIRESEFRAFWFSRNQMILDWLLYESSSIICLQEFWVGNEELVQMYLERLTHAGYMTFKLARTNNRGDGLLTAVRKDCFRVISHRELLFNDCGDRVAQLLHVQSNVPLSRDMDGNAQLEILIVNTHLLFPHDSGLSFVRLNQVHKILQYLKTYQKENLLKPIPILLCGDLNGSKRGHVYKFLRSQGFVSSYDTVHHYSDNDVDAHRWVSHRNHRGNICGVDFIWLCNPNMQRKPLKTSWAEAAFGIIKASDENQLRKAQLSENDAFAFLKGDTHGNFITYSAFCEALRRVKLFGLSYQDTNNLWKQADIDGNGVVDYEEFKRIWNFTTSELSPKEFNEREDDSGNDNEEEAVGFELKDAILHPREVEKGTWPENYSLSDHARLTVMFSPARMPHSQFSRCS